MKVACKQAGLMFPQVGVQFVKANIPYEVSEKQAKILLTNTEVYIYSKNEQTEIITKFKPKKEKIKIDKKGNSFVNIDIEEVDE